MRTPVSPLRSIGHAHGPSPLGKHDWGTCAVVPVCRLCSVERNCNRDEGGALLDAAGRSARAMAAMTRVEAVEKNWVEIMMRIKCIVEGWGVMVNESMDVFIVSLQGTVELEQRWTWSKMAELPP